MKRLLDWSREQHAPVAFAMAAVVGGAFVLSLVLPLRQLALMSPEGPVWGVATYWVGTTPDGGGLIGAVFGVLILATLGTRVERSMGSARWLALWVVSAVLAGLGVLVGGHVFGPTGLIGAWPPLMALVMEWCLRNGASQVLLMGLIPVSARVLGLLAPLFAAFSVAGPVGSMLLTAALLYGLYYLLRARPELVEQRQAGHQTPGRLRREARYYEEVRRREKERAERDQLRRLLESSVQPDDEPKD